MGKFIMGVLVGFLGCAYVVTEMRLQEEKDKNTKESETNAADLAAQAVSKAASAA
jgi:putative Mn2+ efflux pump MntP